MLTDAEMQRLLDMRVCAETGGYSLEDLLALDAALPKLVEEVRRLRCSWVRANRVWAEDYDEGESEMTDAEKLAYYERKNHEH